MCQTNKVRLFSIALAAVLLFTACSPKAPAAAEKTEIRLGLLPVLDVLPMVVAQQEGLFSAHNLDVEIIPVASAPERDQLIAAGQADGIMNELTSVLFLNKDKQQVQAIRFARAATTDQALFSLVSGKASQLSTIDALKGQPIGISQGTVIEYVTDRLLDQAGFSAADKNFVPVPKIPDRLALLGKGELKAATLPEPFVSMSLAQGDTVLLDDRALPAVSFSIITFRTDFLQQHPEAAKAFLAAVEEAVQQINATPDKFSSLMVDQKMVPATLGSSFKVPSYPLAGVPSEVQFDDVRLWLKDKGYLDTEQTYNEAVNSSFLP